MSDAAESFSQLLSEAPLAAQEDTATLVGALSRSSQPGKFVLVLGPGNSLTLDIDDVKAHEVLGGGVGQMLVQLKIPRDKLPGTATQRQSQPPAAPFVLAIPHHASVADFGANPTPANVANKP
jgi:hypothetical protein